jgi:dihydroorotase
MLADFDTNFKVNPPLREKADTEALLKALKDGTIDVLCSGHTPHEEESKSLEFDLADSGIINLQTFAANLIALSKNIPLDVLLEKVTVNPRRLLQVEIPKIEVEAKANLTLFDPHRVWRFDEKTNFSKSKNSPWFGKEVTGKAIAVFNNGRHKIEE